MYTRVYVQRCLSQQKKWKRLKGLKKEQWFNNIWYTVEYYKPIINNVHEEYKNIQDVILSAKVG